MLRPASTSQQNPSRTLRMVGNNRTDFFELLRRISERPSPRSAGCRIALKNPSNILFIMLLLNILQGMSACRHKPFDKKIFYYNLSFKIIRLSIDFYHPMDYNMLWDWPFILGGREALDHSHSKSERRRRKNDHVDQTRRGHCPDGEEGLAPRYGPAGTQHQFDRDQFRKVREIPLRHP